MDDRPADLMSIQAELPLDQGLFEGEKAEILRKLKPAWKIKPAETQALGDAWVKAGRGLAKPVPSAVIDGEWNVQLDPLRADMALLTVIEVKPFPFDERIDRGRLRYSMQRESVTLRSMKIACTLVVILSHGLLCFGQFSKADKETLGKARSPYVSLVGQGLQSFECSVHFDLSTLPKAILPDTSLAERKLLGVAGFKLDMVVNESPVVTPAFPESTTAADRTSVASQMAWMRPLIFGFFQTWRSKGLHGPLPGFDELVESVQHVPDGYRFALKDPGTPVLINMDSNFVVLSIISGGGTLTEKPVYSPSPQGLVYTANEAINLNAGAPATKVGIELKLATIDGFQLPQEVHLQVNDNVNVLYRLSNCTVKKGLVLRVAPPVL
jgi:hypothetical protein